MAQLFCKHLSIIKNTIVMCVFVCLSRINWKDYESQRVENNFALRQGSIGF